jgi:hypothetical protein
LTKDIIAFMGDPRESDSQVGQVDQRPAVGVSVEKAWENRRKALLVLSIPGETSRVDKAMDPFSRAAENINFVMNQVNPVIVDFCEESGVPIEMIRIDLGNLVRYRHGKLDCNGCYGISTMVELQKTWNHQDPGYFFVGGYPNVGLLAGFGNTAKDDILRAFGAPIPKQRRTGTLFSRWHSKGEAPVAAQA